MARSTGPILAIGGITLVNQSVVNGHPINWRVPVAAGLAAGLAALFEKVWADGAVGLAYIALVTVLFSRLDKSVPSPAESFEKWWNGKG